MQTVKSKKFV